MCGIAGFTGPGSEDERAATLRRMNGAIAHRGPDDEGTWIGSDLAFGMRRLSIIDLEGGHQPMWREDGIGVVYNGEIYNYRALKADLERDGYVFRTRSDTEVLLHLYHRDGLEGLHRLEGMFAVALHDPGRRRLHLVRDRFGVKPLYYTRDGARLLFASEIKGILAGLDRRPPLNLEALHHYLTLRYVPGPETIWKGVFALPPGSILSVDLATGKEDVKRWWTLHYDSRPEEPGRRYVEEFEALFLDAVDKRLLAADVPVGVLLSGGLDSSAVSMAAALKGHRDLHTFSVAFEDGGVYDETGYARQVAEHVGSRHHEVRIGQKEFVAFLPDFGRAADQPLADLASVPLYYVCRLARQHVKAVLSGEGSDEILAGYDLERSAERVRRLRRLDRRIPRSLLAMAGRLAPWRHAATLKALSAGGIAGYMGARASHITFEWDEAAKRALWRTPPEAESTEDVIRSWYRATTSSEPIDQVQEVMIGSWLVEDLLMKADKMSMANSLELREPFLDHALAEWAARLPLAWKVGDARSGPVSKRVLREFCRGRLPEGILTRPKQGFPVPAYRWLAGPLASWSRALVLGPEARIARLFSRGPVEATAAAAASGDGSAARRLWVLLVLESWMRTWDAG